MQLLDDVAGDGSVDTSPRFRPKVAERRPARAVGGRGSASKAVQQVMDYSYVYTDLKIIGGLSALLFGALFVLYLVLR